MEFAFDLFNQLFDFMRDTVVDLGVVSFSLLDFFLGCLILSCIIGIVKWGLFE